MLLIAGLAMCVAEPSRPPWRETNPVAHFIERKLGRLVGASNNYNRTLLASRASISTVRYNAD